MTIVELSKRVGITTLEELEQFANEHMQGYDDIYVCLNDYYKEINNG